MTLNHIHLGTTDLARSRSFYETYFGFRLLFDHKPGVFLANEAKFLLAIDPVAEVPKLPSWYHLGFCLDSDKQVFAMYEKMKSGGVVIARDMMAKDGEFASYFCLDPDGYKIEVSWHRA